MEQKQEANFPIFQRQSYLPITSLVYCYEVNPDFVSKFEAAGMKFIGQDERNVRMEVGATLLSFWISEFIFIPSYNSDIRFGMMLMDFKA